MPQYRFQIVPNTCFIALFLVFLSGCAYSPQPISSKPDWTSQGSGAFHTDRGPVFQGTGWAEEISNSSLLRAAADNRAKTQLAGLLDQYVNALIQYAGHKNRAMEAQQAVNSIVRRGLDQALITDHWYDEAQKKLYARCILELGVLKPILTSQRVSDKTDVNLSERADQVFEAFITAAP